MSKKLSRSKRRELREQGQLDTTPRAVIERIRAERRADEERAAARPPVLRDDDEPIRERDEEPRESAPVNRAPRRDRTVLVLLGLTALAAVIFWLTQRSPAAKETKIDVHAPPAASASAKPQPR